MMASRHQQQHLILRTACSGGGDDDDDDDTPPIPLQSTPTASTAPPRHDPAQGRRRPRPRLESLPVWCDVAVLAEVAAAKAAAPGGIGGGENSDADSLPVGNAASRSRRHDAPPHVVERQRFNPCGMDNVLVFPSSSSSSSSSSSLSILPSSYLLRLSSCRTSSSLLLHGDVTARSTGGNASTGNSSGGSDNGAGLDLDLDLDLPVRPHPAALAFAGTGTSTGARGEGLLHVGPDLPPEAGTSLGGGGGGGTTTSSSNTSSTALLATVHFDLRPAYAAMERMAAEKKKEEEEEEEKKKIRASSGEDEKKTAEGSSSANGWAAWNPLSQWHPNGGYGSGRDYGSGGIPTTNRVELERMLDKMLLQRSYNARQKTQQQEEQFETRGGTPPNPFAYHPSSKDDLLVLQAAMDREIRDLNLMLSGLGLVGLALVGSYVYTVRRILHRRPASASGAARLQRQKRRGAVVSAASDAHSSCGRSSGGSSGRAPPPIGTVQVVRDAVVQGLVMANVGDALRAAVGAGVASASASASASCSPSKSDGESVSTAPSTPETPSPRATRHGQHKHLAQKQDQGQDQDQDRPQEASKPMIVEKRKQPLVSPERKEMINAFLARVKAPTPVKHTEDEGGENQNRTTAPTAVTAGKANEVSNAPTPPVPSRKAAAERQPLGGKAGGAFTFVPNHESSAAELPASNNMTSDIFAPASSLSAICLDGIVASSSSAAVKTPTLTPMRKKGGERVGASQMLESQMGRRSKPNAISIDPRASPSFAQMLQQKQQQLTPPEEESSRELFQGNSSVGGSQKMIKKQPQQQQQPKPRRKLTPPTKSKVGDASALASGGFEHRNGKDDVIQGRNLDDAIENTFFRDYWDE